MWLGELITDRGVGNGMSLLIFTSIIATFPGQLWPICDHQRPVHASCSSLLVGVAIIAGVVFVEQAQRRIPVQYAKRMVGRRMYGGTSTYIPLKVNMAGVIPVIFASSLLYLPHADRAARPGSQARVGAVGLSSNLARGDQPLLHDRSTSLLIIFFTLLLRRDHVQPGRGRRQHEEVRRLHPRHPGGQADRGVPRLRAHPHHAARARSTSASSRSSRSSPSRSSASASSFPFGGTSLLIMVGVGLDTVKQIETQLQQRNYEGFLR